MPHDIAGVTYFTLTEVAEEVGVTRQTLWRWRNAQAIPLGRKFPRRREVVYTGDELADVREYANRMEPIVVPPSARQLSLFNGHGTLARRGRQGAFRNA